MRYDAIRALLRLAAWLGFAARAARCCGSRAAAAMALSAVLYSLSPLAVLAVQPAAFLRWALLGREGWGAGQQAVGCRAFNGPAGWLAPTSCLARSLVNHPPPAVPSPHTGLPRRWRCVLVSAWNVGHAAMTAAFLPQVRPLARLQCCAGKRQVGEPGMPSARGQWPPAEP